MGRNFNFFSTKTCTLGFSLPELLVSISIITIVTGILLFRFTAFNGTILLNNQAYELALDVRQAQVSGVSVRGDSGSSFNEEYGLYFDMTNNRQYLFFRDIDSNAIQSPARYHAAPTNEVLEVYLLDNRFEILRLCVNTDLPNCGGGTEVTDLHLTFSRPDFDAKFYSSGAASVSSALIVFAPVGKTSPLREVHISRTGQISVVNN